jgi:hypothetical protein
MLRMKIVQHVPRVAVNMGYIKGDIALASVNVSLLDHSRTIPANTMEVGVGKVVHAKPAAGAEVDYPPYCFVSSRAIVPSFESVVHPDVRVPTPLYYIHHVGKGASQDDYDWPIILVWNKDTPSPDDAAMYPTVDRLNLRSLIEVIDETGNVATDIKWDVRYTALTGYTQVNTTGKRDVDFFRADLLTDRPSCNGKTYFVRYRGYDTRTGEELPNHVEVLNARPTPLVGDPHRLLYDARPYLDKPDKYLSCYRVPVLARSENCPGYYLAANYTEWIREPWALSPGLAVFGEGLPWKIHLDRLGTVGRYVLHNPPDEYDLCATTASIEELCQAINSCSEIDWLAIPLSNSHKSWPLYTTPYFGGPTYLIASKEGAVARMEGDTDDTFYMPLHFKHRYDMTIRPHVPFGPSVTHAWYPRISAGEFTEVHRKTSPHVYIELRYGIPEFYSQQEWSHAYEPGVREATNESAEVIGEHTLQVKRYPIHSAKSIKVMHPERGYIQPYDADLENGKLFFEGDLTDVGNLSVDYAFNDNLFDYRHIDLSPVTNPDIVGKYVGMYIVPMEIRVVSGEYDVVSGEWDGTGECTHYPSTYEIAKTGTGAG